jgi:hypothetical protein
MEKEDNMQPTPLLHLRDVRDVSAYVGDAAARIGVPPTSGMYEALVRHGVACARRVERALPPETSLRGVLDDVLREQLERELRRRTQPPLAALAVA